MIPVDIDAYYKLHSRFYDITRWAFLFGRISVEYFLPGLKSESRILDLGCGTGRHLPMLSTLYPDCEIIGLDQSSEMLAKARAKKLDSVIIKEETYSLDTFEPNSFDLIVASYSITMMDNIEEVIQLIKSHLKQNKLLVVLDFDSTPYSWFSRWMKKNHVSFEPNIFELLDEQFELESKNTQKAYFNLYSYTIFRGKNSTRN